VSDIIGQRGEAIAYVLLTRVHPTRGQLFRPQFLGDKWPFVDYLVALEDAGPLTPFFFVQVKATRKGYTAKERRLKVGVPQGHVRGLASYPAPTYIVGVDEVRETGYIVSANGENLSSLSSLITAFPINAIQQDSLWAEVRAYWDASTLPRLTSTFVDSDWR
jgi:hypothetical protein